MINLLPPFAELIFDNITAQESFRSAGDEGADKIPLKPRTVMFHCSFLTGQTHPRVGGWPSPTGLLIIAPGHPELVGKEGWTHVFTLYRHFRSILLSFAMSSFLFLF